MEHKKKKVKKFKLVAREFLNKSDKSEPSVIVGTIEIASSKHSSSLFDYCNLKISDCSRIIELELSTNNKKHYENSMYKLDQIIKVCQQTKLNLTEARNHFKKKKAFLKEQEIKQKEEQENGNSQKNDAGK